VTRNLPTAPKKATRWHLKRSTTGIPRGLRGLWPLLRGPDRDLLDDLTQDVFFRVINGLPSYVPSHPFPHWLYTIALNVGRNHARRRSVVVPLDPRDLDTAANTGDRITGYPEDIIGESLMRQVARLPDSQREVVSLRIGADMPYGEIAEILGIPEGTARSRMHTAVGALRRQMGLRTAKKEKK
jgi:RNA polymerase sigma factor (sigma-70 family)